MTTATQTTTKSPKQAKAALIRNGMSVAEWSRLNAVPSHLVYRVLNGNSKSLRGVSHKIAVLLGIKDGEIHE